MEPTVVENNGVVATFSDGTKCLSNRLSEYGFNLALQPETFKNIFKVGRTKAEIHGDLKDPSVVAAAASADGEAIGTNLPTQKINVGDKGFHSPLKFKK